MTEHNRVLTRGWMLSLIIAGFLMFHLLLFHMWRHTILAHEIIPGALISVAVVLALAKHVGLFAVLLRRFQSVFRRQLRP